MTHTPWAGFGVAIALAACASGPDRDVHANEVPSAARPTGDASATTGAASPGSAALNPSTARPDFALPADWATIDQAAFARALAAWTKDQPELHLDDASLLVLARALLSSDGSSVRAAVILANTRDPRAGEVLLARLEARLPEGARSLAGDIVAAAAFGSGASARDAEGRLENLARGAQPHPVLEVRVECAIAALARGRDGVIPFLLDILREGTSTAVKTPTWRRIDWNERRMQDIQDRAAHALSLRAGIECAFRAGGPLAVREIEVVRLAQLVHSPSGPK